MCQPWRFSKKSTTADSQIAVAARTVPSIDLAALYLLADSTSVTQLLISDHMRCLNPVKSYRCPSERCEAHHRLRSQLHGTVVLLHDVIHIFRPVYLNQTRRNDVLKHGLHNYRGIFHDPPAQRRWIGADTPCSQDFLQTAI